MQVVRLKKNVLNRYVTYDAWRDRQPGPGHPWHAGALGSATGMPHSTSSNSLNKGDDQQPPPQQQQPPSQAQQQPQAQQQQPPSMMQQQGMPPGSGGPSSLAGHPMDDMGRGGFDPHAHHGLGAPGGFPSQAMQHLAAQHRGPGVQSMLPSDLDPPPSSLQSAPREAPQPSSSPLNNGQQGGPYGSDMPGLGKAMGGGGSSGGGGGSERPAPGSSSNADKIAAAAAAADAALKAAVQKEQQPMFQRKKPQLLVQAPVSAPMPISIPTSMPPANNGSGGSPPQQHTNAPQPSKGPSGKPKRKAPPPIQTRQVKRHPFLDCRNQIPPPAS